MFALGAAIGRLENFMSASATGASGIRTAAVGRPPRVREGITSFAGRTIESGPGQNFSISIRARQLSSTSPSVISIDDTWRISGLSDGRPFVSYIRRTASASSAFAPRP